MDLYELPWWKVNDKTQDASGFLQFLTPKELTDRLTAIPLSHSLVTSFLENHVVRIEQIDFSDQDMVWGRLVRCSPLDQLNFYISLNKNNSLDLKASTLIHECMHGVYRVASKSVEEVIWQEELRFFTENREFSIDVYNKYSNLKK
jgi:hypothetical protein